jgi:Anthranilate/para-aminobenzoate synthases component I
MTAMAQVTPTLGEFIELAKQGNVIPVFAEFIADGETPVSAFKKLDRGGYSFLFESTEKNDVSGRFSFVGVDLAWFCKATGARFESSRTETSVDSKQAAIPSMRCEN